MKSLSIILGILLFGISFSSARPSIPKPDTVYVVVPDNRADTSVARPAAGWEAFGQLLHCPDDARQSRRGCAISLQVYLDSRGTPKRIEVTGSHPDSAFLSAVEQAISSTRWTIARRGNYPIQLEAIFIPRVGNQPVAFVIESNATMRLLKQHKDSVGWSSRDSVTPDARYALFPARSTTDSDGITNAVPICGWDSLLKHFSFPELAKRAGFQASFLTQIVTDSLGDPFLISVQPEYEIFVQSIRKTLRSVPWSPATRNGKPVQGKLFLPMFFSFRDPWHQPLVIESR